MWLGIDIGTSAVKVIAVNDEGVVAADAAAPLDLSRPHEGWCEQDPAAWNTAVDVAVRSLPESIRVSARGVGMTGQMHGAVLLDGADRVLRPAILWNDGRAFAECTEIDSTPASRQISGNAAMPGFTAPKLRWIARHEPKVFAATRKILLPKDLVRLHLTGEHATDSSDASGTLWLDVSARAWSERLLTDSNLELRQMPRLFEGPMETGRLRSEVAAAWGTGRLPVVAGAGDNAAAAIGAGAIDPGDAILSLGTSGVLFVVTQSFMPAAQRGAHAFCHALPDRWHQMAVMLSAASALDWASRSTGCRDVAEALAITEQGPDPFSGRELFLPYLDGERTPHNSPSLRASWHGLGHRTDRGALLRAVMEGVAFGFADGLDVLESAGSRVERATVLGGGGRSRYWGRILATALGRPLVYREGVQHGPAYGAALLARLGVTGVPLADVFRARPMTEVIEPEASWQAAAAAKWATYRSLGPIKEDTGS